VTLFVLVRYERCMPRAIKPKVEIKRVKAALGSAYRIYIDGEYMGAGLTRESAREAAKRIVVRLSNRPSLVRGPPVCSSKRAPLIVSCSSTSVASWSHTSAIIDIHQPYELGYWSRKFGVSVQRLSDAVQKVGTHAEDVAIELGKKWK
jgi:hypothetical protein